LQLAGRFAPPALRGGAFGALEPASARPPFAVGVGGRFYELTSRSLSATSRRFVTRGSQRACPSSENDHDLHQCKRATVAQRRSQDRRNSRSRGSCKIVARSRSERRPFDWIDPSDRSSQVFRLL